MSGEGQLRPASPRRPAPGRRTELTAQGHPRTIFRRAIERGNLMIAEVTAREIGHISLLEALELTALIAQKDPGRHRRAAGRWLQLYMGEMAAPTVDDAGVAVISLGALGGPRHAEAMEELRRLPSAAAVTSSSAGRDGRRR
jgi:hypothetical protein